MNVADASFLIFAMFSDVLAPIKITLTLLNRPAFLYDRRGDFFLPTHHHAMPVLTCPVSGSPMDTAAAA